MMAKLEMRHMVPRDDNMEQPFYRSPCTILSRTGLGSLCISWWLLQQC